MMDAKALLLKTISDIESRVSAGSYYDLLRAAGLLRQLLLDENPLVHAANRSLRVKLEFKVLPACDLDSIATPTWHCTDISGVGLTAPPGILSVPFKGFLSTKCGSFEGTSFSVKDVIKSCANTCGGVHLGKARTVEDRDMLDMNKVCEVNGMPAATMMLLGIVRVTCDGLKPLIVAVKNGNNC